MSQPVPRLRVFAGPNGSGKSTIKDNLPPAWLGVYVNADEIEKSARASGSLSLADFKAETDETELREFLRGSSLLIQAGLVQDTERWRVVDHGIDFNGVAVNSYHASVLADFIRHKLLQQRISFTFETVMSSADKVSFLCKAQRAGFRTYLYYVATEDPEINVSRVRHRVATGGHSVPTDKITSRYVRSLDLLYDAVACSDRAYVFDNSGSERVWVAEVTDGSELEIKTDLMPYWFKTALWDKFDAAVDGE
jgi:predicted ABC-type ATPase